MSCLVTRPANPVPGIVEMSTECSAAILRTKGVERRRRRSSAVSVPSPPLGATGEDGAGRGTTGEVGGGAGAGFDGAGAGAAATAAPFSVPITPTRVCTDRKSTPLNSSPGHISHAVFWFKKKKADGLDRAALHRPVPSHAPTRHDHVAC